MRGLSDRLRDQGLRVGVVIPALNEEESIAKVLADIPRDIAAEIVVVDNGSKDRTAELAMQSGARVIYEPRKGYGFACQAGVKALSSCGIVVFMDGDYSDYPEEMGSLLWPIVNKEASFTLGSRIKGKCEKGALLPQAYYGNIFATLLIRLFFRAGFTDLGPFRAIKRETLSSFKMRDTGMGWTVEMQVKAARVKTPFKEVSVRYRRRIGVSKITGTLSGTLRAGFKIIYTIMKYWLFP